MSLSKIYYCYIIISTELKTKYILEKDVLLCFVMMSCRLKEISVQFSTDTQSCATLCDHMKHSTPGLSVHHQIPEFTQTQVHQIGDAIQPSHPLSPLLPLPQFLPALESFSNESTLCISRKSTGVSALASFLPKKSQG